ncbi:hypothetical protein [Desulfatibacillum aliphaticivorans]|uniref:hypothetical protein n=1 Tax=Desulfatibacillum aliphaticivorans TaxID=218208 RepID=UPI0004194556|nr:hypothetical protein [Desulfatibacillum aliphaticivorans]
MKLSEDDVAVFYKLMFSLQLYVCSKLGIFEVADLKEYDGLSMDQKGQVRDALWDNADLIDSFVEENPFDFTQEELAIVLGWKGFIKGDFFIERLLKKYAVFIKDKTVYGVLGLVQDFDEFIEKWDIPLYTRAVLLPFKGKIVYDGLMHFHHLHFGGGIKEELKFIYMRAKQNDCIIESFDEPADQKGKSQKNIPVKDWTPELEELAAKAKKLRSSAGQPAALSPAFSLVKASIEFAQLAASGNDDYEDMYRALKKAINALKKSQQAVELGDYF